jgi:transcriptional regulator with XRE-family HTH domain
MIRSETQLNAARLKLSRLRRQLVDVYKRLPGDAGLVHDAQLLADHIDEIDHDITVATWGTKDPGAVSPPTERALNLTLRMSDALYAMRTKAQLTQDGLAIELGTSQPHVARLESELREDHSTLQVERWAGTCGHMAYPVRFISKANHVEAVLAVVRFDLATLDALLPASELTARAMQVSRRVRALTASSLTLYGRVTADSVLDDSGVTLVGSGLLADTGGLHLTLEPNSPADGVVRLQDAQGALRELMEQQLCQVLVYASSGPAMLCIGFRLHEPDTAKWPELVAICRGVVDVLRRYEAHRDQRATRRQLSEMFHRFLAHFDWKDIEHTMAFMKDLHCTAECDLVFIGLEQPRDDRDYWSVSEHHLQKGRTLVYIRPEGAEPRGMRDRLAVRVRESRKKNPKIWPKESDEDILTRVREEEIPAHDFEIVRDSVLLASTVTTTLGYRWNDVTHSASPLDDADLNEVIQALRRNRYLPKGSLGRTLTAHKEPTA